VRMPNALLRKLSSLVVPPLCVACREPEMSGAVVCPDCRDALLELPAARCLCCGAPAPAPMDRCRECRTRRLAFESAWAPFPYEGAARRIVIALKSRGSTSAAAFMAAAIAARALPGSLGGVLVPVPGHPSRSRSRGYDHGRELALELGRLTGLPVSDALRRTAGVRPQVGLARAERAANAHGSVTARPGGVRRGSPVVLVDDVYTTGATLDACAHVLLEAGAARVTAVCFARTIRQPADGWRSPWSARSMEGARHSESAQTSGGRPVRIEIRGRNTAITDTVREHVQERFTSRIGKQVSDLAQLEVELLVERNPANSADKVAEATLHLKGVTLRAREASADLMHSVDEVADKLARQVKRHRDKRRGRRDSNVKAAPPQEPA
jgi:ribosomal subunit interface protein